MTPQEIEALLQQHGSGQSQDDYDEASEPAGVREQRKALLAPVLNACQDAWSSRSEALEEMAQKLGDGSRDGECSFDSSTFRELLSCHCWPRLLQASCLTLKLY